MNEGKTYPTCTMNKPKQTVSIVNQVVPIQKFMPLLGYLHLVIMRQLHKTYTTIRLDFSTLYLILSVKLSVIKSTLSK